MNALQTASLLRACKIAYVNVQNFDVPKFTLLLRIVDEKYLLLLMGFGHDLSLKPF